MYLKRSAALQLRNERIPLRCRSDERSRGDGAFEDNHALVVVHDDAPSRDTTSLCLFASIH